MAQIGKAPLTQSSGSSRWRSALHRGSGSAARAVAATVFFPSETTLAIQDATHDHRAEGIRLTGTGIGNPPIEIQSPLTRMPTYPAAVRDTYRRGLVAFITPHHRVGPHGANEVLAGSGEGIKGSPDGEELPLPYSFAGGGNRGWSVPWPRRVFNGFTMMWRGRRVYGSSGPTLSWWDSSGTRKYLHTTAFGTDDFRVDLPNAAGTSTTQFNAFTSTYKETGAVDSIPFTAIFTIGAETDWKPRLYYRADSGLESYAELSQWTETSFNFGLMQASRAFVTGRNPELDGTGNEPVAGIARNLFAAWDRGLTPGEAKALVGNWLEIFEPETVLLGDGTASAGSTTLVVADATHSHTADAPTLTQNHVLAVADASHTNTADSLTVSQNHVLAVDSATHAHTADSVTLTQSHVLAVDAATHGNLADNLTLTQLHVLAVADASHSHSADHVAVTQTTPLTIQDATHAHTADAVALTVNTVLTVHDATHIVTSDNIVFAANEPIYGGGSGAGASEAAARRRRERDERDVSAFLAHWMKLRGEHSGLR